MGEAALPSGRFAAPRVGGRGPRKRPSADAVLGRPFATVGPGSSASRVRRARGRVPRHPGGGLARPGEKPGSVRTHLRRWRPATDGRHTSRSAGPGTKSAAREVCSALPLAGRLPSSSFPCTSARTRARTRPPAPLGGSRMLFRSAPRAGAAAGTQTRATSPERASRFTHCVAGR